MILQQPIERAQMQKLLATGRTDLLTQFVSKKGRRFKAFLVKTPEGKVGFEFEPRAERRAQARAAPPQPRRTAPATRRAARRARGESARRPSPARRRLQGEAKAPRKAPRRAQAPESCGQAQDRPCS